MAACAAAGQWQECRRIVMAVSTITSRVRFLENRRRKRKAITTRGTITARHGEAAPGNASWRPCGTAPQHNTAHSSRPLTPLTPFLLTSLFQYNPRKSVCGLSHLDHPVNEGTGIQRPGVLHRAASTAIDQRDSYVARLSYSEEPFYNYFFFAS